MGHIMKFSQSHKTHVEELREAQQRLRNRLIATWKNIGQKGATKRKKILKCPYGGYGPTMGKVGI